MSRKIKRMFDVFFCILIGVIAIPVLIIAMVIVRVCSPDDSLIFRQVRVGYRGRKFEMLKLRTMTNDRNAEGDLLPEEERLKWWGKLIRKTNVDELMQIVHILCGEMSLIGPRPLLPEEMLVMTKEERKKRQSVLPGIVGWESVNEGKSNSRAEMAQYDLYYVDHWCLALDIKIFFYTIYEILSFKRPDDSFRAPKLSDEEIKRAAQQDRRDGI